MPLTQDAVPGIKIGPILKCLRPVSNLYKIDRGYSWRQIWEVRALPNQAFSLFGRQTMGTLYKFKCPKCRYSAEVSGGDDMGMYATTTTIMCKTCKELLDVTTSKQPYPETLNPPEPSFTPWVRRTIQCTKSASHEVERWKFPGPCPKCGKTMKQGEITCCWD